MERKSVLTRKSVSTSRNKVFFSKIGFLLAEKNLEIKENCFKQTENRFPLVGIKNLFKNNVSTRRKNCLPEIFEKSKKIVANISDKSFKQAII